MLGLQIRPIRTKTAIWYKLNSIKHQHAVVVSIAHYLGQYLMVTKEFCRYLALPILLYALLGSQLLEVWNFPRAIRLSIATTVFPRNYPIGATNYLLQATNYPVEVTNYPTQPINYPISLWQAIHCANETLTLCRWLVV